MRKNSFAEKFKSLFSSKKIDEEFFEDLTDTLIEGDVGAKTAFEISDLLEDVCKKNKITTENGILQELKKIIPTDLGGIIKITLFLSRLSQSLVRPSFHQYQSAYPSGFSNIPSPKRC